jgi:hypothetical protein
MDLNSRLRKVVPIFFVQVLLCCLFSVNMNDDKDAGNLELKDVKWMYWLGGVMIQVFAADEQLGKAYQGDFWNHVFTNKQYKVMHNKSAIHDFFFIKLTYLQEFYIRRFMDFFVNSICRLVVLYAFPIMLCVEEPLDFVKDCTAVFFMTTLDDIAGDGISHDAIVARLKFRLFYAQTRKDNEVPMQRDGRNMHEACLPLHAVEQDRDHFIEEKHLTFQGVKLVDELIRQSKLSPGTSSDRQVRGGPA